ncbi:MAG: formylglycine-generating enzyme family protein [Candidatus Omnitrophota bacterium]
MSRFIRIISLFVIGASFISANNDSYAPIRIEFSGDTAEENGLTVMGAGFDYYPRAKLSFGAIPTDHAFTNATDGRGAIITANPGQGLMIFGSVIETPNAALIRCSIRTAQPNASLTLAAIDQGPNVFVSTNSPNNSAFAVGEYKRLSLFFTPPSTGFQPLIQIYNWSSSLPLTVYLDNFEIYILDPHKYYHPAFLDGDENDPPISTISLDNDEIVIDLPDMADSYKPLEMILIKSGAFMMGSPEDERGRSADETPHQTAVSQCFYMAKYELTQGQWRAVMGYPVSEFDFNPNHPVDNVSWEDCQQYIKRLNAMGKGVFRLPTEAEWEYASRAGTTARFWFGDALEYSDSGSEYIPFIDQYMWWTGNNTYNGYIGGTKEAGIKTPNPWGLYDMYGNVWEWCQDWYGAYADGPQIDPQGPESGTSRTLRGGSWNGMLKDARSAARNSYPPYERNHYVGFRLVRELEEEPVMYPTPLVEPTPLPTPTPLPASPDWPEFSPGSASGGGVSQGCGNPKGRLGAVIDSDGNPIAAWSYLSWDGEAYVYVMKFDGEQWVDWGTDRAQRKDIANAPRGVNRLVVDPADGRPIITMDFYFDEMRKFDGSAWQRWAGGGIDDPSGLEFFTDLAFLPDKTPVAFYLCGVGSAYSYFRMRKFTDGKWMEFSPGSASGYGIAEQDREGGTPQLAVTNTGEIYVLWRQPRESSSALYIKHWDGIAWISLGAGSNVSADFLDSGCNISSRALVLDSQQKPLIAYNTQDGKIFVQRFEDGQWIPIGGNLCEPERKGSSPVLVMRPDGRLVAIWQESGTRILYAKQLNGGEWHPAGEGAASGGGIAQIFGDYDAVCDAQGRIVLVYTGEDREIYVKKFEP